MWGWLSYDPGLWIWSSTAPPIPRLGTTAIRPGDNKFTAGIFARNPDTGDARWFYQIDPHDLFDHDAVNELILTDFERRMGHVRQAIVRPDRNGLMYVFDRRTGEVLAADAFAPVNSNHGVDLKTGRLQYAEDKKPANGKVVRNICPAAPGAKDWNPSAYSKATGLLYVPHNNLCMDWRSSDNQLYCRDSLPRRLGEVLPGKRWNGRRIPRLGRSAPSQGLGHSGTLAGMERRGGQCWRACFLWNARWVVQSR